MSIIDGRDGGASMVDANAVVVSTIVGFYASRLKLGEVPVLSYEKEADREEHRQAIVGLNRVLSGAGFGLPHDGLPISATPAYLTGSPSSTNFAITGHQRSPGHRELSPQARGFALELIANTTGGLRGQFRSGDQDTGAIRERGAYYGIVDDPEGRETRLISTTRRLIPYRGVEGYRWKKGEKGHGFIQAQYGALQNPQGKDHWDMGSMASLDTPFERRIRSGDLPNENEGVVGYCHGMNWAIMHCKLLGRGTPYEIAVGEGTTKLASCFGCTTFMYATGFPPSAIHFGRAESWVPVPDNALDNPEIGKPVPNSKIRDLLTQWSAAVAGYIRGGAEILAKSSISEEYRTRVQHLKASCSGSISDRDVANKFLDALTMHESEVKRVIAVTKAER